MKIDKKIVVIASVLGAVCVAAGTAFWLTYRKSSNSIPDTQQQTTQQITKSFQSQQFQDLDPNERQGYSRQAMQQIIANNIEKYFELPEDQRTAYLDEVIDSMGQWREQFGGQLRRRGRDDDFNPPPPERRRQPDQGRRNRRANSEQFRVRTELRDPAEQAKRQVYMQALQQRMLERGIEPRRR